MMRVSKISEVERTTMRKREKEKMKESIVRQNQNCTVKLSTLLLICTIWRWKLIGKTICLESNTLRVPREMVNAIIYIYIYQFLSNQINIIEAP